MPTHVTNFVLKATHLAFLRLALFHLEEWRDFTLNEWVSWHQMQLERPFPNLNSITIKCNIKYINRSTIKHFVLFNILTFDWPNRWASGITSLLTFKVEPCQPQNSYAGCVTYASGHVVWIRSWSHYKWKTIA